MPVGGNAIIRKGRTSAYYAVFRKNALKVHCSDLSRKIIIEERNISYF